MMFKVYRGFLLIHPCWYELPLGTYGGCDLSVAPSCDEEHDSRDTARLYRDTMHEDAIEFRDPRVRVPTQHELKIAEYFDAYYAGDMDNVANIDEREEERRMWKAYH